MISTSVWLVVAAAPSATPSAAACTTRPEFKFLYIISEVKEVDCELLCWEKKSD